MTTNLKAYKHIYDNIMQRASEDVEFRAALAADPKDTIQKEYEVNLPENMEIKVHESDLNTVHLALPLNPRTLQEGELTGIQGGGIPGCEQLSFDCTQ